MKIPRCCPGPEQNRRKESCLNGFLLKKVLCDRTISVPATVFVASDSGINKSSVYGIIRPMCSALTRLLVRCLVQDSRNE